MGAGNYYTNEGKFIYVELDHTEDYELNCMEYDDLVEEIRTLLPKSYSPCLKWGKEGQIILVHVFVSEQDVQKNKLEWE